LVSGAAAPSLDHREQAGAQGQRTPSVATMPYNPDWEVRAGLKPAIPVLSVDDELDMAVEAGDVDAIRKAVANGADVNAADVLNKTPLHKAAIHGRDDICRILVREFGADPNAKAMGGKRPLDWAKLTNRGTPQQDPKATVEFLETVTDAD
jgi:ankyrin repeat protein